MYVGLCSVEQNGRSLHLDASLEEKSDYKVTSLAHAMDFMMRRRLFF